MDREPLPDYSSTIRAQIEREVAQAKTCIEGGWHHRAKSVAIDYVINSHHGIPLFRTGDTIAGLPVTIATNEARTIRVGSTGEDVKIRW